LEETLVKGAGLDGSSRISMLDLGIGDRPQGRLLYPPRGNPEALGDNPAFDDEWERHELRRHDLEIS
jgi:hypothetical protein